MLPYSFTYGGDWPYFPQNQRIDALLIQRCNKTFQFLILIFGNSLLPIRKVECRQFTETFKSNTLQCMQFTCVFQACKCLSAPQPWRTAHIATLRFSKLLTDAPCPSGPSDRYPMVAFCPDIVQNSHPGSSHPDK